MKDKADRTVLIFDDRPETIRPLLRSMRGYGIESKVATSVAQFRDFLEALHDPTTKMPDAIILDMMIPGLSDLSAFGHPAVTTEGGSNAGWKILKNIILPMRGRGGLPSNTPIALISHMPMTEQRLSSIKNPGDPRFDNVFFFDKDSLGPYNDDVFRTFLAGEHRLYEPPTSGDDQFPVDLIQRAKVIDPTPQLISKLQAAPGSLDQLSSRQFEEIVAELLDDMGWDVKLTPATRDGGVDIFAYQHTPIASVLCVVDAKHYRHDRKIGVGLVRSLLGTVTDTGASAGMMVTTSSFTVDARAKERDYLYRLSLRDFRDLGDWIQRYKNPSAPSGDVDSPWL